MRLIRFIPAIVLALAVTFGGVGYAPLPADAQGMTDNGKMGAMPADESMPDCPMCVPDDAVAPICAPGCPALAAILPLLVVVPVGSVASRQARSPGDRPGDAAVGPEPPPPKPAILS